MCVCVYIHTCVCVYAYAFHYWGEKGRDNSSCYIKKVLCGRCHYRISLESTAESHFQAHGTLDQDASSERDTKLSTSEHILMAEPTGVP